ncbi:MAG: glycoside hydrolase family 99-like domain-containing protein, partial [Acidithiobacillus sp.]|nr:glycoside hydrolase family 99-like domain-containing protein [Acidithiobacillus sp.]
MKTPSHTPDLVVVVGMHRSGTSAITRGLATLGCTLGDSLIEGIPGINDKGFWEDVDINTFNQQLLEESGSDWSHCVYLPTDYFNAPILRNRQHEARTLLAHKLRQGRPLALKEPRISILLPFWQRVFADLGLDVVYLHAMRNPFEVAQSLLVRDGFSQERSMLLWFFYHQAALRHTRNATHVVVDYAAFLEDPIHQLSRISGALGLEPFDPERPDSQYYLREFLDSKLRHARSDHPWWQEDGSLPAPWKQLYGYLEARSRDADAPDIFPELDRNLDDLRLHQRLIEELEFSLTGHRKTIGQMAAAQKTLEAEQIERARHLQEAARQQKDLLSEQRQALVPLQEDRDRLQQELELMLNSKSWRITLPIRRGRMALTMVLRQSLRIPSAPARWIWRRLPLSMQTRAQIRAQLLPSTRLSISTIMEQTPPTPVRCRDQALPLPTPVRMIAFHLPQYHEIPENNQWWGKGFTEWSNVQPAEPLFPGHYQPHVPLNGYYDLTDPTVLPRQAEQARRYGIEGFCFYF